MDEPTRGIDVGAKYEIYQIMIDLVKQGKSIIMISSEMPELIGMSNRIIVMCNGHITGEVEGEEATQERIMSFATQFDLQENQPQSQVGGLSHDSEKFNLKDFLINNGIIVVLVLLAIYTGIMQPTFVSGSNLKILHLT